MVTALGLNVSDVSMAAAVDAAVQFVAIRFAGADSGKLGEEPVGSTSLIWDRAPEWRARRVLAASLVSFAAGCRDAARTVNKERARSGEARTAVDPRSTTSPQAAAAA